MQYINGYICTCLALFFILVFIRLPEYHILQFHTFLFYITIHLYTSLSSIIISIFVPDINIANIIK
uniref:Uncharacterized protein n=1 Tax=Myoviridae sp. ct0Tg8 TaxID=2826598 RepID=A0A8S5NBF6_9CAUD|nr:MAG TPA: hypothetical protein [Myoviridae sp. ct0Tg8]